MVVSNLSFLAVESNRKEVAQLTGDATLLVHGQAVEHGKIMDPLRREATHNSGHIASHLAARQAVGAQHVHAAYADMQHREALK